MKSAKYSAKKQTSIRRLKFGGRQSNLDHILRIGVVCDNSYRLGNNYNHVIQREIQIDNGQEEVINKENEACEEVNDGAEDVVATSDKQSHDEQSNANGAGNRRENNADGADPHSTSNNNDDDEIKEAVFF